MLNVTLRLREPEDTERKDRKTGKLVPSVKKGGIVLDNGSAELDSSTWQRANKYTALYGEFMDRDELVSAARNDRRIIMPVIVEAVKAAKINPENDRYRLGYLVSKRKGGGEKPVLQALKTVEVA